MLLKFKSALNYGEKHLRKYSLNESKIPIKNFCYIWNKMKKLQGEDTKKLQKNKYDYVDLRFGADARSIITNSIIEVSSTVAKTFGPLGKNVAISERDNPIIVTKDGVTVAKYIKFSSRKKNLGCRLLGSIAGSTNTYAGDGTTTSTVLAAEIVKKGNSLIDIGFHPIEVKKGIEFAAKKIIEYFEEIKIKIKSHKDLFNLAMITTNQNREIAEIVSEALSKVGLKGLITLEESQTGNTELKIEEGMFINYGLASLEYIMNQADNTLYLENPLVMVIADPVENIGNILKVMEYAQSIEKPLVIFTSEMKKEPLSILLYNQRKQGSNFIAVNVPDYINDGSNLEILRDICTMTGAKFCRLSDLDDDELENSLLIEDKFGSCRKCKLSEHETVLMGVKGDKNLIMDLITELETKLEKETNEGYKSYYKHRINMLEGRASTIYVGGLTSSEVSENRDKIVDALNSCQTGLEFGILPGAGTSFIHGLKVLEKLRYVNNDVNAGVNIFYHAIVNTLKHLFKNSPVLADIIVEKVKSKESPYSGYNLNTQKFSENMLDDGIIDSFNTLKTAIEDAVSVASLLITTECIVFKEYDYEPPPLDSFRNRIKSDPEFRLKMERQFNETGEAEDSNDTKLFSSII